MSYQDDNFKQAHYDYLASKSDNSSSIGFIFFVILKISFVVLLVVWFLKLGFLDFVSSQTAVDYLPFSALLDYLKKCPMYYSDVMSFLNNFTILEPITIEVLPGLAAFLNAIRNIYNVLILFAGTIISGIGYLFYIIKFIFI